MLPCLNIQCVQARLHRTIPCKGRAAASSRSVCHASHPGAQGSYSSDTDAGRRALLAAGLLLTASTCCPAANSRPAAPSPELIKAFQAAMNAQGDFEAMETAWTHCIELAPGNSAAWSNRGATRLQAARWQPAFEDFTKAAQLEEQAGQVSSVVLNGLGNTEGALGRWEEALQHYKAAAADPEMSSIATANAALAAFQLEQQDQAIATARQVIRRDPEFLDMRCALAGFLWADGQAAAAEDEWETLQQSQEGLGSAIYSKATAIGRVQNRWPPRATAALTAFLELSDTGDVMDYSMSQVTYRFPKAQRSPQS